MARPHQREGRGHLCAGYAFAGHPPGQGFNGHLHRGSGATDSQLCGPERTGEHPKAPGRGDRRRQSQRSAVWQAGDCYAGELWGDRPPVGEERTLL